jgi:hypothetical protein
MLKRKHKKMISKTLFAFLVSLAVLILCALLMLTPVGSVILKKVLESKIDRYIPDAEVTYLDYGVNNFSLAARKGHNVLKIYGAMFPLNAMFEGNVENLTEISPYYRGKMNLSGRISRNSEKFIVEGMSFFANGYMNFKAGLGDGISIDGKGSDFDIQKLLYIFKLNYPWINGKTDIELSKKEKGIYVCRFKTFGHYERKVQTDFTADTVVKMKTREKMNFESKIDSGAGKIFISGVTQNDNWKYTFDASDINLSKLQSLLLYPFKKTAVFKGSYDSANGIMKFKGNGFEGFADSKMEINFNMDAGRFFEYTGIKQILKGSVSGTLKIKEKSGTFDVVCTGTTFINGSFVQKIRYLTGINLSKEAMGKLFFKGSFDAQKAVFDLLSTNQNISISVKKGVFEYPGKYSMILYLRKNNDIYKLKITDRGMKLLEKRDFRNRSGEILVF